jgi:hypothetical protein
VKKIVPNVDFFSESVCTAKQSGQVQSGCVNEDKIEFKKTNFRNFFSNLICGLCVCVFGTIYDTFFYSGMIQKSWDDGYIQQPFAPNLRQGFPKKNSAETISVFTEVSTLY